MFPGFCVFSKLSEDNTHTDFSGTVFFCSSSLSSKSPPPHLTPLVSSLAGIYEGHATELTGNSLQWGWLHSGDDERTGPCRGPPKCQPHLSFSHGLAAIVLEAETGKALGATVPCVTSPFNHWFTRIPALRHARVLRLSPSMQQELNMHFMTGFSPQLCKVGAASSNPVSSSQGGEVRHPDTPQLRH